MKAGENGTSWQYSGMRSKDLAAGGHAKGTGAGGAGTHVTRQRGEGSKREIQSTRMVYRRDDGKNQMLLWWKTLKKR